jgi:hypothetical protein
MTLIVIARERSLRPRRSPRRLGDCFAALAATITQHPRIGAILEQLDAFTKVENHHQDVKNSGATVCWSRFTSEKWEAGGIILG